MVIELIQIILVEPDQRLGWGIAKLVGNLQDLEVYLSYIIIINISSKTIELLLGRVSLI